MILDVKILEESAAEKILGHGRQRPLCTFLVSCNLTHKERLATEVVEIRNLMSIGD